MIGFGFRVVNFSVGGTFFVSTSLVSLDSQKKVSSDSDFRFRDADEVETFDGDAFHSIHQLRGSKKRRDQ